jgi:putative transposase
VPNCACARAPTRRWTSLNGEVKGDARPAAIRPTPANALSEAERQRLVAIASQPEFASLPPSQIVPTLADRGEYLASESSFYRVLKAHNLQHHRGRARAPSTSEPRRHSARGPGQVWVWDITWLPGPVAGTYYYLYLMLDLFSRKVVGWEVHDEESAEHASQVIRKASLAEGRSLAPLVLHSDNGSPMKGATMLTTLQKLGIAPSFSRPGVSDDNAQAEAFFRTPQIPPRLSGEGLQDAGSRAGVGAEVRALVQHRAPPLCAQIRHAGSASRRGRHRCPGGAQGALRKGQSSQSRALARHHPELGSPRHRVAQSGKTRG